METTERQRELMASLADAMDGAEAFTADAAEELVRAALADQDAKLKDVALACRLAVTGRRAGPGLFDILSAIGPSICAQRLRTYKAEGVA